VNNQQKELLNEFLNELFIREERFCITAIGWFLRVFSKTNCDFVTKFLLDFEIWTTREVIKTETKYLQK
jgi:hypothetical protein